MFGDSPIVPAPAPEIGVDATLPTEPEGPKPAEVTPPTPEQIRAAEAVFSRQEEENRQVAALLGLWAGGLLVHDQLADHLDRHDKPSKPRLGEDTDDDEDDEE